MKYTTRLFYTLIFLSLTITSAQAQIYKCTVNGKTTFSDQPCAVDSKPLDVQPARGYDPEVSKKLEIEREAQMKTAAAQANKNAYQKTLDELNPNKDIECAVTNNEREVLQRLDDHVKAFSLAFNMAKGGTNEEIANALRTLADLKAKIEIQQVAAACSVNIKKNAALYADLSIQSLTDQAINIDKESAEFRLEDSNKAYQQYLAAKKMFLQ